MQFTEKHKSISVLFGMVLFPVFLLVSCVPLATDFKKSGLNESPKGFAALEKTPDLYEIMELQHLNAHTIGDGKYFKRDNTAAYELNRLISFKNPNVAPPDNFIGTGI